MLNRRLKRYMSLYIHVHAHETIKQADTTQTEYKQPGVMK